MSAGEVRVSTDPRLRGAVAVSAELVITAGPL